MSDASSRSRTPFAAGTSGELPGDEVDRLVEFLVTAGKMNAAAKSGLSEAEIAKNFTAAEQGLSCLRRADVLALLAAAAAHCRSEGLDLEDELEKRFTPRMASRARPFVRLH